ncbi:uncharacterized protein [Asterias amurensis]|uniref:uncharacterized protein isoform X2 n=1 Tax=Asterias amurensis TaxID=7602 RepID=UPI003AB31342
MDRDTDTDDGRPPKRFKDRDTDTDDGIPRKRFKSKAVEVLDDDETMEKVARKIGAGPLRDMAEQLNAQIVTKYKVDSQDDPVDQAMKMLEAWKPKYNGLDPVRFLWRTGLAVGIDLSPELEPLQQNPPCPCGNNESLKFRRYFGYSPDEQYPLIGICCVPCGQEWLEDKYLFHPDLKNKRPSVEVDGTTLKK